MESCELKKYEEALLALRSELHSEIDDNQKESAPVKLEGVMGRVSRMDAMQVQQMALEVKRRRQQRLTRVGTALQRIHAGEFGYCGRCEAPIKLARLDAFPDAVLCVRCADDPR